MTTGWSNPGAALGAGLNSGAEFGQKVIGANREREQHGQDEDARAAAKTDVAGTTDPTNSGQPASGDPNATIVSPQDASAHIGFLSQLGSSLKAAGQGIEGFFGGQGKPALPGAPGATGAPPAGALPPQPAAAPGGAVATGAGVPSQAVQVPQPNGGAAPTANTQGGVAMMADGGPVSGGGWENPGASLAAGLNSGADFASKVTGAAREREQHGLDQADRQAVAQYAAGAAGAPPGASAQTGQPGAPPVQPDTQAAQGAAQAVTQPGAAPLPPAANAHVDAIEAYAGHLKEGALPDDGTQSGTAAIPPPGGAQTALASAAQNPAAAKGIPEKSDTSDATSVPASATQSGDKAVHSLTPDYWDKSDVLLSKAVQAAALAGHDPDATYTALNHMRTSFIQGHMLRNLSAANTALLNNDSQGVETALHNMNYYLPNGQNLNIQKDPQSGQLIYQNALQPYLDPNGNPTDAKTQPGADGKAQQNKPNMIPVDAAHLQMLGQAVLDPMKVNDVLMAARSQGAKNALEQAQAKAALLTGQGGALRGQAAVIRAQVQDHLSSSQIYKNTAEAQWYAGRITNAIQQGAGKGDALAYKAGTDASKVVMDLQQGLTSTAPAMEPQVDKSGRPVMGPDGKPAMVPSMAPNAGKSFRDPSKVPDWLQGKSPAQIGQISALAGEIGAANRGAMPAQKAAEIAGKVYSHQGTTHRGGDGKPEADVKFSKDRKQGWIWNGNGWDQFNMSARTGASLAGGNVDTVEPYDGATGGSQEASDSLTPDNPLDKNIPQEAPNPDDDREAE